MQVASDLKPDVSALATDLRVSQRTMYEWLKDILQAQQVQENAKVAWLDLLAWTQREVGEGVGLAHPNVGARLVRFCKTGESAKSYQADPDDPDDEKSGPDPYQMVRAGLHRGLSVDDIATKETLPVNLVQVDKAVQELQELQEQQAEALGTLRELVEAQAAQLQELRTELQAERERGGWWRRLFGR